METLKKPLVIKLADELHETENQIRLLEAQRDRLKIELAGAVYAAGQEEIIGSYGQTYVLSRPSAKYIFNVPKEEYERVGILDAVTPPAPQPKMTKTLLDKLLKTRQLDDAIVADWQQQGWYTIDRSDEITVRQKETKLETLKAVVGF